MSEPVAQDPIADLRRALDTAAEAMVDGSDAPAGSSLERPPKAEMGDYSTNAAMLLAPVLGQPPREIAEQLGQHVVGELGESLSKVEVAGPGFLNLHLSPRWHRHAVASLLSAGAGFGRAQPGSGEKILLEFVSANPTGPTTVAAARHGAYGDSLGRLLEWTGAQLSREYLLNDMGGQVERFAASIAARMRGEEPPEDGYAGEYIVELGRELGDAGVSPDDLDELGRRGTAVMRDRIEATLARFGIRFDTWFSERSLHESGAVDRGVETLRERGHVYDSEGAVWMRTTEFGDDKDRVLIRADGQPTYFCQDIAYHRDKFERGAERLIDPLGADHHGYVARVRGAIAALGLDPDAFEAPMLQLVNLVERGERTQMSKRKGQFVTLDELLDDIGVDAARFFMVQRNHETTIDLDLDLARQQTQDNPVYYVQYAHARVASILRKATAEGVVAAVDDGGTADEGAIAAAAADEAALQSAGEPTERALVRRVLEFPEEVLLAAERRTPHRLTAYATATAADFHAFYRDCQVVGAEGGLEAARLGVCLATKRVVASTLGLLGVSAPERM
jgi:arginyl-tRNA synthetase